jgi:hypothetical protein
MIEFALQKCLAVTNALAYYSIVETTTVKSFIILVPEGEKLFFDKNNNMSELGANHCLQKL